ISASNEHHHVFVPIATLRERASEVDKVPVLVLERRGSAWSERPKRAHALPELVTNRTPDNPVVDVGPHVRPVSQLPQSLVGLPHGHVPALITVHRCEELPPCAVDIRDPRA